MENLLNLELFRNIGTGTSVFLKLSAREVGLVNPRTRHTVNPPGLS